jgi:hypothetical protein
MTLEEKLFAALSAICPRVFQDFAPVDTPRPYVTFQQIGGETVDFLDRALASQENAYMQINVWSDSRKETKATIQQIEAALIQANEFQASPQAAPSNDFDVDMERYSSMQDFSIWADR